MKVVSGIAGYDHGDYTEQGLGQRILEVFGDEIHWCKDSKRWYTYDENTGLWKQSEKEDMLFITRSISSLLVGDRGSVTDSDQIKAFNKFLYNVQSKHFAYNGLDYAKSEVSCVQADFDAQATILGLPGGKVVDLESGEVKDSKPEYMITMKLNGSVKESVSERFEVFIRKFLESDDLRMYFWRFCGCALLGQEARNSDDKMALFMDSVSGSGKSTFLKVLKPAMGDYYKTADIRLLTTDVKDPNKPNPLLCHLQGARIVGISEIPADTQFVADVFKRLAAADVALTRDMYSKTFEYVPDFKMLVMANDLPRPDATDDASFRCRFRRIRVNKPIEDKDPDIERNAKTQEWRDDMVTWLVQGVKEYKAAGKLDDYNGVNLKGCNLPVAMKEAIKQYIGDNDDILDFFTSNFRRDDKGKIPWLIMFKTYRDYTKDKRMNYYNFVRTYKKALSRFNLSEKRAWVEVLTDLDDDDSPTEMKYLECVVGIRKLELRDSLDSTNFKKKAVAVVPNTNVS